MICCAECHRHTLCKVVVCHYGVYSQITTLSQWEVVYSTARIPIARARRVVEWDKPYVILVGEEIAVVVLVSALSEYLDLIFVIVKELCAYRELLIEESLNRSRTVHIVQLEREVAHRECVAECYDIDKFATLVLDEIHRPDRRIEAIFSVQIERIGEHLRAKELCAEWRSAELETEISTLVLGGVVHRCPQW